MKKSVKTEKKERKYSFTDEETASKMFKEKYPGLVKIGWIILGIIILFWVIVWFAILR